MQTIMDRGSAPLTPAQLMMALRHEVAASEMQDFLQLDDHGLATLTRQLLAAEVEVAGAAEQDQGALADLGMTKEQFDAAIQAGIDDMEAGRVTEIDEFDRQMKGKFAFL